MTARKRNSIVKGKKRKKIVMFGLFGQQNLGNDCTLRAMIYNTRKHIPDAEIKCICTGPEETTATYGIPAFDMYSPAGEPRPERNGPMNFLRKLTGWVCREVLHGMRSFKTLKGNDTFIVPGTGLLVDHTTGFRGYPYYLFKWALIAKLCRLKLFIVSVGAGPIDHPISKFLIRSALSLADYRSYRDIFSKNYVEGIGFNTNGDGVYPDLAFSLEHQALHVCVNRQEKKPAIGVGVVDYFGQPGKGTDERQRAYQNYLEKTAAFIEWLTEQNYPVRILTGDVKYDSSVRHDLIQLIEKRGLMRGDAQIIIEPILSVEDLMLQLAKTDIVVSPRFHNVILALMLEKPAIALSHNEKFDSLMEGLGLSEYCQPIDDLDIGKIAAKMTEMETHAADLKHCIKQKTEEWRRALDEQYGLIFNEARAEKLSRVL